ncbi:MAG: type IV pilus modification PilV family protein [Planctomycetota bacterium]|jgi:prepilin-type N-terminal cleavage/methylation domain-containing protein
MSLAATPHNEQQAGRQVDGRQSPGPAARRGFTLIETALATIIVGVGVLAIVSAQQAFHQQNGWSARASTASRLGNEIRELTIKLPRHDPVTSDAYWGAEPSELWVGDFDDLDDFDGDGGGLIFSASFDPPNGPINARREVIPNMFGWSQIVTVRNVDPFDITDGAVGDAATDMMIVDVLVTYQGVHDDAPTEMTRVSWIAPN